MIDANGKRTSKLEMWQSFRVEFGIEVKGPLIEEHSF